MSEFDLTRVLRPGLLDGVGVLLGSVAAEKGAAAPASARAVAAACVGLGASVSECELVCSGTPQADDELVQAAVTEALAEMPGVQMMVADAGGFFAGGEPECTEELMAALEACWRLTRALANAAFIEPGAAGRIVYVAPPGAEPARAGLENLARTLSIEWARYGITVVTIAPGPATTPEQVAGVVAYLASPAGAYFSGCQLDLRGLT
jgi:NAD(P)-dependent dehydrogenase (short-subunit alcohol dehydrogenase family)